MDEVDKENLTAVLDTLIEDVVKMKGFEGFDDRDLVGFMQTLDESKFVISGIIYSNGIPLCDHEIDEDGHCIVDDED